MPLVTSKEMFETGKMMRIERQNRMEESIKAARDFIARKS